MTAKKYFAISLILFAMIAMLFAIVISLQGESVFADDMYTITWLNEDGTLLYSESVAAGETPEYTGVNLAKMPTAQYTYAHTGWDPEIEPATQDQTYTAVYTATLRTYTITWKLDNGTTLETDNNVPYGETPECNALLPQMVDDAQYTYGTPYWSPAITTVTGNQTYVYTFPKTVNTYTVTWKNEDGTVLETDEDVPYDETPTYDGETPTKASTAQYTYAFNGWSPAISSVTGDTTYTATYIETLRTYTITWKLDNGSPLETDNNVPYGATPEFNGALPTKMNNAQYTYGTPYWSPEVTTVTGDQTYTIVIPATVNTYAITWVDEDGTTILETDEDVEYGETPTYDGETPTKASTAQYTYAFNGWTPEVSSVTGTQTYKAVYSETIRTYTITWKLDNGTTLETDNNVPYGETPECNSLLPQMVDDAQFTYGSPYWSPAVTTVTGNQTYTYTFPKTVNTYTITWLDWDDSEVDVFENVAYGTTTPQNPEHITLNRESTAQYSYTFKAWDPSVSATVVGDATYKATYDSEIRTYTITWVDDNGDELEIDNDVEYGVTPTFDKTNPTKDETKQYKYAFDGWSPEITEVTGDATYTATYKATVQSYTVTWVNYDGDELEVDENVLYGEMPVYTGDIPTKPSDVRYDYTFSSWDKDLEPIDGDITYVAIFSHTYIEYTITYTSGVGYSITVTKNGDAITSGSTVTYDDTVVVSYVINAGYDDNNDFEIIGVDDTAYTRVDNTLTNIHTDISISVSATAKNYVITFKQDGINPMPQTTYQIVYAQKVTLPTATKDGHTFVCWLHNDEPYTDATGAMLGAYNFTGGITLEARFSANKYIITYDEYTDKESDEVTYGTTFTLEIPIRPGYVFEGWYYNATQITDIEGDSITAYLYAEDIEAESKWTEITIVLNNDALRHTYRYGKPFEVVATVTPQNASTVTYSVSTEGVISLGQDGNYTIIGIGQTVLRATLDNGGAYKECPISVSDIFINDDYSSFNYLYITINGEEYGRKHAVICEDNTKMSTISKEILEYLNIPNAYVDRTDIGIELDPDAKFKDVFSEGDTLNINLVYNIEKATNTHVSYRLSANTAEFGQKVYLEDLIAKEGYKLGNIIVTNEKDLDVEISQLERSFVMPGANVLVDVLLKSVEVESSTINNISIKSDIGIKSNAKFVVNEIDKNTYNQNITFSDRKQVVYAMHVDYIEGEQSLDYTDKYTIVMNVPKEFIGKDGMEVMYFQNGETIVKQIYIEGDTLTLTLAGAGDIVFVSNIHGSTVYLYWLIIIMLFVDALLGMIFIILFINYQDALQRRRELNGYSTVLPVLLLGAAIASEVAFLVFLGILFLVELIGIAWLALKLTNKYFIYTTYHKMTYVKPQDYNSVVKDIKDRQQNE